MTRLLRQQETGQSVTTFPAGEKEITLEDATGDIAHSINLPAVRRPARLCDVNGGSLPIGSCDCHQCLVSHSRRERRRHQLASWRRETEVVAWMRPAVRRSA